VQKNKNIEKISFKVVQMKFLAMHINNQKCSFDIFMVGIFEPYNVLSIATNIAVLLMTAFAPGSCIYIHTFINAMFYYLSD